MKTHKSEQLYLKAKTLFPGGVNSPVRSFKGVGGTPRFIQRGSGPWIWDADGQRYIDFCTSWGALIHGHAPAPVVAAAMKAAKSGMTFGAPTERESELAMIIQKALPSLERMRFTNSGTEAVMSAIRVARAVTQRDVLVKFSGCYHGHVDSLLVKAGSGALTLATPDSAGITDVLAQKTRVLPYNNVEALRDLFAREGQAIAAVIVEPIAANMGLVPPKPGFLEAIREVTQAHGALLIFDEVITGFRVAWGGAQTLYKVTPDLTCLGKIVGGGLPLAVYGGRNDIMNWVAPMGPVYQAGTLSGNPVAVAAGIAALTVLKNKNPYKMFDHVTGDFVKKIEDMAVKAGVPIRVNRVGSAWTIFFTNAPVVDLVSVQRSSTTAYAQFFHALLDKGVYLPPSAFETAFLSTTHSRAILSKTLKAIEYAFKQLPAA